MKREAKELDRILDRVIDGIRDETVDARIVEGAAERVWERIRQEAAAQGEAPAQPPLRDCDDFRALIPAYVTDSLTEPRALLLEDHVRECVPCRRALKQARAGREASTPAVPRSAKRAYAREWSWAIAAAVLVAVTLFGLRIDFLGVKVGGVITIREVEGGLIRVTDEGTIPVVQGASFQFDPSRDSLRTTKGSNAVLELPDGSLVEMRERSQLAVYDRVSRLSGKRTDSTIDLDRGGVIIEAASQGSGHLFVDTEDCKVAVTGTVFAVSHGIKGSRVSVIEGEVRVNRARGKDVLRPGDQVVTNPAVGRVAVADEIAWSRNVDRHLALLRELTALGRELDQVIAAPELRHSTRLLDRAPAGTVVYVSIPNLSGQISDAYRHVRSKVDTNPVLSEWWHSDFARSGAEAELDKAIARIRDFGSHFGPEIVVTVQADERGEMRAPLILAELERPSEFRDFLLAQLEELEAKTGHAPNMVFLEGVVPAAVLSTQPERDDEFFIWTHGGLFAASPSRERIGALAPGRGGLAGSSFHARLGSLYKEGVEWVLGVDLGHLLDLEGRRASQADRTMMARMGVLDIRHLIIDHRSGGGRTDTRAVLSFDQARRGVASWLAEPGPMGSLGFVSPDAHFAAAFVMKSPAAALEDLFSAIASSDDDFPARLEEFEARYDVNVLQDFAVPLGGEFAVAVDGPMVPNPAWRLIVEVYDPARLQRSLEWTVDRLNEFAAEHEKHGFRLETEESGGRTFHSIHSLDTELSVHYAFTEGYLVAAGSRAMVARALDIRSSGFTLVRSPRFTSLLPADGRLDFSAVAYQNLGSVVGPVVDTLKRMSGRFSPEQVEVIDEIGRNTSASLAYAYAGPDSITVAATSQGGLFGSGLSLFSLPRLLDLQRSLGEAMEEGRGPGA